MRISFLLVVLVFFVVSGFAQVQDTTTVSQQEEESLPNPKLDKSRIYYGGYVTMNFSKNYSVVGAQPLVAYKLTPKLSVGTQVSYEYISDSRYIEDQNGSNYGTSIFSRYRVTPSLYTHTEFSLMSYKWFFSNDDDRKLAPNVLFRRWLQSADFSKYLVKCTSVV
ncbi:hypothetical protein [uncultured Draconibacterium sp.]|uniref:hypothetical protein n=1 Tax=uncultured Draconibacterium sp. TaxID=1573823 RepID=UPI0029C93335|nr:hypothetical protein [uncultured Draconibacterium sp.]